MATSRSAKKRILVNEKKRRANMARKTALKNNVRRFEQALENDPENAPAYLKKAIRALDKAAARGIIHKNTAARKKSRLSKRLAAQA
ncbi:MAG TPA: 30S ribosomal protein S20 [Firmicutes bacterium]|nr:30S ribosomal protein S20 [Bacillota bacterium]